MDFRDSRSPSVSTASPIPLAPPTNDDIEAVILMATSSRSSPDGRAGPLKDTRTQLFVGNLPYRVRWQDLKDLFRKAGTVLRADVSLGPDNRSRGHGTVLLATAEDAGRAIDMFNGYSWQTRILEVRPDRLPPDFDSLNPNPTPFSTVSSPGTFASPQVPSSSSGGFTDFDYNLFGFDGPSSSSGNAGRNLFVGNLPFHCQWQDLKDLFRQAGTIVRADVALGQDGRSRGFGTVVYATDYDSERAVKMFNGYEYNGRVLKVHFDKFSQSTQPMTTPASPALTALQASSSPFQLSGKNPNYIVMPSGYMLDYGPASAPNSPYDVFPPQLQMSIPHPHHTHSHIHQPQPSAQKVEHPEHPSRPPLLSEVDRSTNSLMSTHISDCSSQSGSSSESVKPPTSVATSNSSRTSPSSEHSTSKSPQGQSQSPPKPPSTTSLHSHPHHPGTISIPPAAFSLPVHNMSPMGVPMSPYYSGMSPLHHPHAVPMTPHGLPPITPSMPPFTFLPPMPLPSPHMEAPRMSDSGHHPSMSRMSDVITPTYSYHPPNSSGQEVFHGESQSEDVNDQSSSSSSTTEGHKASRSSFVNPYFQPPIPGHRPSFGHPHPLAHHQLTPFSPGLAMSPGTFWGRPGAGPNPYINPAVGAPVHVVQGSPGGFFFHPQHSPGLPGSVGAEMGSRGGTEPGGYFDNVTLGQGYFPPIQSYFGGLGANSVEGEILKDEKDKQEDKEQELKAMEEEQSRKHPMEREYVLGGHTSYTSPTSVSSDELGGATDVNHPNPPTSVVRKDGFASRAHSMSTDVSERPQLPRPESDPPPTTIK